MVQIKEQLLLDSSSVVDTEGNVRIAADLQDANGHWQDDVPERVWTYRRRPIITTPYDYDDGESPHRDQGGNLTDVELTQDQERAIYEAGYGNVALRRRVEERLAVEQRRINKAGIEAVRNAGTRADEARGIDTSSPAYLAQRRREAERRRKRA